MSPSSAAELDRAAQLFNSGAVDAAAAVCESLLQRDRRNPALRHLLGVIRLSQGRADQAVEILRKLSRDLPGNSPVMVDLGRALGAVGKCAEGDSILRRAAKLDSRSPMPWIALGSISEATGQREQAKTAYQEALNRDPRSIDALVALGDLALGESDADTAISHFQRAVEVGPNRAELLVNLGNALKHANRTAEAERTYATALELDPNCVLASYNLGLLLFEIDRALESLAYLENATRVSPDFLPAHYNLGLLLADVGDFERALSHLGIVIDRDPTHVDAAVAHAECLGLSGNLAAAETRLVSILRQHPDSIHALKAHAKIQAAGDRWQEAACTLARALDIASDDVELWLSAYKAHTRLGNTTDAEAALDRAYALDSKAARAGFARRAMATGNLAVARQHFDYIAKHEPDGGAWRVDVGNIDLLERRFSASAWDAIRELLHLARAGKDAGPGQLPQGARFATDLSGKIVFVRGEQGIGDELFFMRWLPELLRRGARVIYKIHSPKLVPLLFRQHIESLSLIGSDDPVPEADICVWVNELPAALMSSSEASQSEKEIPHAVALRADAERSASWIAKLAALGPPPYIGVTWRAGATFSAVDIVRQGLRSLSKQIEPSSLGAALRAIEGTILVMQRKPREEDLAAFNAALERPAFDLSAVNDDLEDALALLGALHAYIGVSNTNMHLLAGLGRSAYVLVPWLPEWRWLISGSESPWFPGFRVFRQSPSGVWDGALTQLVRKVAEDLEIRVCFDATGESESESARDSQAEPLIVPRALDLSARTR